MAIESLWITDHIADLQQKLVRIHGLHPAVLVSFRHSSETDAIPKSMLELVVTAIRRHRLKYIVVCGQPNDVPLREGMLRSSKPEAANHCSQMLKRIAARVERQERVRNRIRTRLDQIRSIPEVTQALISRTLHLCGIFYIPEVESFLIYDDVKDRFTPTIDDA